MERIESFPSFSVQNVKVVFRLFSLENKNAKIDEKIFEVRKFIRKVIPGKGGGLRTGSSQVNRSQSTQHLENPAANPDLYKGLLTLRSTLIDS